MPKFHAIIAMRPINNLAKLLAQPYPFYYEGKAFLQLLGILFFMTFGFNYLFEPFNVYRPEHKMSFFLVSMVHTAVASLSFIIYALVLQGFSKLRAQWTVGKDLLGLTCLFLMVGIGQFLIRDVIYNNVHNWSWQYLIEEIRNTFLVSMLFIAILVPTNFRRLYERNQRMAGLLSAKTKNPEISESLLIRTQLQSDNFNLKIDDFIYARAEGNYVEFFIHDNHRVVKKLKRLTIRDLDRQLQKIPGIIRTHRSYVVNLSHVKNITGNAQGYKLDLQGIEEKVGVSRNMIPRFEAQMT